MISIVKRIFLSLFLGLGALFHSGSWALKTNFSDSHTGISIGGGAYYKWLPNDNAFDPIPTLAPSGITIAGSDSTQLLPLKFGIFKSTPSLHMGAYGRYMINLNSAWTATGTIEGSGTTAFGSIGFGGEASFYFWKHTRFRLGLSGNAEYITQKAKLTFTPTGGTAEEFNVRANSILVGLGLVPEIYLGDLWALSLFTGYQYGYPRSFSAPTAGSFLGQSHSTGTITAPAGGSIRAEFGGFLFEITLRLAFM